VGGNDTSSTGGPVTIVRAAWTEFKAFALSGNMFDLALGFIIGTAFSRLVNSLAGDVIMQAIAAVFGKPDFRDLSVGPIRYGAFLTELLNFILLAAVLFMLVKLLSKVGLGVLTGGGGTRATRNCTHCKESVSVRALKCKWCGTDLHPLLPSAGDEEIIASRQNLNEGSVKAKVGADSAPNQLFPNSGSRADAPKSAPAP
jgi:large conductance mechanosensitive channel